jgi:hypothetical protein
MQVDCTLRRRTGSAIACQTVDVGPGGMCVCSPRPLAADEELTFELERPAVSGRGRVLRQQGHDVYAIRFEGLREPLRAQLERLAAAAA